MKIFRFLSILLISCLFLTGCNNIQIDKNTKIIFSGNLENDYELSYNIVGTPEFIYDNKGIQEISGWRYTININPSDEIYKREKQSITISFLSDTRLNQVIESDSENKIVKIPQLGITITRNSIEMENNFGIYCPSRDGDNFITIPGGEGIINEGEDNEETYNSVGPAKYINHYKNGNIGMFYEWGNGNGLIIDDLSLFSKNCMIEIGEIGDFLPLNLPFNLNFNNFEYTTIGFIKELSDTSNCISSHKIYSPHNNYISFYTENLACQLWYETGTILENVTFENRN